MRKNQTGDRRYYCGARCLDPRTSRWLNGDPAIGEYLPGQGGVFSLVNLYMYYYAGNNPVKYVDPDGDRIKFSLFLAAFPKL
jgi:RHS repeat-associated protein